MEGLERRGGPEDVRLQRDLHDHEKEVRRAAAEDVHRARVDRRVHDDRHLAQAAHVVLGRPQRAVPRVEVMLLVREDRARRLADRVGDHPRVALLAVRVRAGGLCRVRVLHVVRGWDRCGVRPVPYLVARDQEPHVHT
eukprot:2129974-Rhodomonas_salina.3